jgi:hypothetical protein
MLDAYYCTTAGVVQGTSHPSPRIHGSIAGHAAARHHREILEGRIHNPPWCLASRAHLISLCHEIRLAPARGTRTHTRTTRRKVNTRPRAVKRSANIGVARVGRDIALLLFAAGIAEGAQDWLSIAPPPQSTVKSVTWSMLDRHQASPFELLPFPLVFLLLLCRLSLPGPIVKHFLTML